MEENTGYMTASTKKRPKLFYGGYSYGINKETGDKIYWRCARYNELGCRGKVQTDKDGVFTNDPSEHNHEPDASQLSLAVHRDELQDRATSTQETTQAILNTASQSLTPDEAALLPSQRSLQRRVQRARRSTGNVPADPQSLAELQLPAEYLRSKSGKEFLLYDSTAATGDSRVLLFATEECLEILGQSNVWYCDGTFKCVPRLFLQLYSIHALYHNVLVPVLYALMPNKQEATYKTILQKVKDLHPPVNPSRVVVDFELAAINALKSVFPAAEVSGCFFHLSQNIFKHSISRAPRAI